MSLIEAHEVTIVDEPAVAAWPRSCAYARQVHWTLFGLALAVLSAAWLLNIEGERLVTLPVWGIALPEMCYWKQAFGVGCPGCGLTRCFISLADFDVAAAWHFNPAGILMFAGVALQIPYRLLQLARLHRGLPEIDSPFFPYALVAVCVLLVVQWLVSLLL